MSRHALETETVDRDNDAWPGCSFPPFMELSVENCRPTGMAALVGIVRADSLCGNVLRDRRGARSRGHRECGGGHPEARHE